MGCNCRIRNQILWAGQPMHVMSLARGDLNPTMVWSTRFIMARFFCHAEGHIAPRGGQEPATTRRPEQRRRNHNSANAWEEGRGGIIMTRGGIRTANGDHRGKDWWIWCLNYLFRYAYEFVGFVHIWINILNFLEPISIWLSINCSNIQIFLLCSV
jgi:hypothetical protein